jgi:hypothetical protein
MKTLEKLQNLKNADLLLLCGEMSAQELRTLNAFRSWVVCELQKETEKTWTQTLDLLESRILDSIHSRCPKDSTEDAIAIPLLNALEKEENEALHALECLRGHIKKIG